MNRAPVLGRDRPLSVHRLSNDVQNPAENFSADGNHNRGARIDGLEAANQALGGLHGDGPNGGFAQVKRNFDCNLIAVAFFYLRRIFFNLKRVPQLGKLSDFELHIDNRPNDLCDGSFVHYLLPNLIRHPLRR